MKIHYDKIADALYISLKKSKVFKTVKINDTLLIDTTKDGSVVGIEVLGISLQISKDELQQNLKNGVPVLA